MSFSVTGKGVLEAKFQDWRTYKPAGHNPLVQNPLDSGYEPGGYVRGVHVRQSWNLAFKSEMCDSVGFYPALPLNGGFWPGVVMSGGLCPVTKHLWCPVAFWPYIGASDNTSDAATTSSISSWVAAFNDCNAKMQLTLLALKRFKSFDALYKFF